ncbi:MAG: FtsX-like permease family protein [Flavobacteriales bacterium]
MMLSYIKIAYRNLLTNKVYAFISIIGLAIGISGATLISLYIEDEMSYDLHHEHVDDIYRMTSVLDFNGPMDLAVINFAAGPTLKQDYPEVENFVRFMGGQNRYEVSYEDHLLSETNIWMTDSTIFDVFTYNLLSGDKKTALTRPRSIVLTETLANKIFGHLDCLNKQVKLNNTLYNITGVIKNPPLNSEIRVNALLSLSSLPRQAIETFNQDWFRVSFITFIKFKNRFNLDQFKPKLIEFEKKYVQPWAEINSVKGSHKYELTPLKEVHFDNRHEYDLPKGNMSHIYIFSALALFLLIIAAINFINLTLAHQAKRAKEVGVRKTLGADRIALIFQFLIESLFVTSIALIVGLGLCELFLEPFNSISGKMMNSADILKPKLIGIEICVLALVGILGGIYPAFILSSYKPIKVLKGGFSIQSGMGLFRKGLILIQFSFAIFMIAGTMLIGHQMNFMREMDLGFDKENLLTINFPTDTLAQKRLAPWVENLKSNAKIKSFSRSRLPSGGTPEIMFRIEQNDGELIEKTINCLFVDDAFIDVMGLNLIEGRKFSEKFASERQTAFIINETAAKQFGWTKGSLNKRVQWGLEAHGRAVNDGKVVGLINDFNFMSLHQKMEPLILIYNGNRGRQFSVRLEKGDYQQTLVELENQWKNLEKKYPFEFTFFDQSLDRNYRQEIRMYDVFKYFSGIAITLSCLGLFALLSFSIESRKKEIGIRKVLGASVAELSWTIVKEFVLLFFIAFLLASPLNFYFVSVWEANFAYQAPFSLSNYILPIIITLFLAMFAILYHGYKIWKSDPIAAISQE